MRLLLGLTVALALLGCQPSASFQPEGACVADGRAPGAYPELEAELPKTRGGVAPAALESGRSCTDSALGTMKTRGVTELRFAGATWDEGNGNSQVIAVLAAAPGQPPLDVRWVEEFYESGARASSRTENIEITHPTIGDAGEVYRLQTLNGLSFQSVAVWPGDGFVHVVIVATTLAPGGPTRADHDALVADTVEGAELGIDP